MSRSEMMRDKRSSYVVELLKLIKRIDNYHDTVVSVFEGEDAKYYGTRIDVILGSYTRKNLTCGGKSNVLRLRDKVSENVELSQAKIIYFVDTDFDENVTDENIYSTPCYSVENLYASCKTLENLLKDELGLCAIKEATLINDVVEMYEKIEVLSDEALVELNAFIMAYSNKEGVSLNLNNHEVNKFLAFSLNEVDITKLYTFDDLLKCFSIGVELDKSDFFDSLEIINSKDKNVFCRGKFRLDYFRIFVNSIFDCARNGSGVFINKKIKPKITLSKNNILSDLSQYASTPDCLITFLESYKSKIAA
jgi:hypothetical protein